MAKLNIDIKRSSDWLVKAFAALDKNLDYSVKSVELIENLITEQFEGAKPKKDSLFARGLGWKLFAISSYMGEVEIKNTTATK